ncbi:hypothetical protein BI198_03005 [Rheinheimera salexigens]|uniref:Major facilitator superfamily (MFS) profile domain-containing protein n=1 Tax=Rheinheimera salexigens TaxID=1628148 RepID=A0A1E7Q9P3_9GAMM|nr:hypothetical protein BI198_03005 [Rheinheimera salexigens]
MPALVKHENPVYSWYVVIILMLCYALAFIDRQILSLLVDPIKADLGISDTQFGLLQGLAFALFYTFVGLFLANLADKKKRVKIIAIGVAAWSVMTAMCGLSKSFFHMFLARVGVAVGEAALSPAAYSIISDYFPKRKLGKAMSVYTAGVYLGSGLAFLIGGLLIVALPDSLTLPIVGELKNWQLIFISIGLPGLLFALLSLTIREPKRGRYQTATDIKVDKPSSVENEQSITHSLKFFKSKWPMFVQHNIGFAMLTLVGYAFHSWAPSFFIRTMAWSPEKTGMVYGTIAIIASPLGVLCGGILGDWILKRGYNDAFFKVPFYGAIALLLPAGFATLTTDTTLVLTLITLLMFFSSFHGGMAVASLHTITPIQYRAQATAIYLFVINLIGLGLGPVLVAVLTDYVFQDPTAVGKSLSLVSFIIIPIAILLLWRTKAMYNRKYNQK